MARSRSLPSTLFDDPDFFELSSDAQVILIGLVLIADDHGRGLAHTGLLARKFNKPVELIEETLALLEQQQLVTCYQDEQQRYYALCRWTEWETLSKPARSKYPAPPSARSADNTPQCPGSSHNAQEKLGDCGESIREEEGEEEKEEEREGEEEGPPNITFLAPTSGGTITAVSQQQVTEATQRVARILKLATSEALARVVAEYLPDPALSVLGEADAAREWIDDPRRNRKRKRMTPSFFRRWLQREQVDNRERRIQATGTGDKEAGGNTLTASSPTHPTGRSLMDLEAQYQAEQTRGRRQHDAP